LGFYGESTPEATSYKKQATNYIHTYMELHNLLAYFIPNPFDDNRRGWDDMLHSKFEQSIHINHEYQHAVE
jgi:hypothetical protein